ncbi:transcription termination/antitermination protein NusA [Clostridia bacterium]|nr:transcription termination/antitermination protein NusA [Clostridia bacterium]
MNKEFIQAMEELEKEKEISKDLLIEAIEMALLSAYKKNYGTSQNVRVNIDREEGDIDVYMRKDVVDIVEDGFTQVAIDDVITLDPNYQVGDAIEYRVTPKEFGRIAAQTAKQVVFQRIREAERGMIFEDYVNRQGEIITGSIQRISNETVFVNMGKTEGILAITEQVRGESYNVNSRMKFYILDVRKTMKGPQIYLSRSHPGLVRRLFELEVPEIQDGVVEIRSMAREAGSRTKIAVFTEDDNIDPVGACVGSRGIRVQSVVDELFGEKIDIISWSDEPVKNISSALSPAKVESIIINEDGKSATAVVPDYQLSLAIGKEGQNVRLAAKLCGWKIDIKSHSQYYPGGEKSEEEYYYDASSIPGFEDEQREEMDDAATEETEKESSFEADDTQDYPNIPDDVPENDADIEDTTLDYSDGIEEDLDKVAPDTETII